ncbi:MAG TPA: DUF378 domain-containing protein [Candidatus Paceibacterota bacterium]|nr:DUF378 domain-containing protein [Candidatus Paceibacterota bacterium]
MKYLHIISFILLIIGGLNWLLYAFGWNLVNAIFGGIPALEQIIYVLVGLAAVYEAVTHKNNCKVCGM